MTEEMKSKAAQGIGQAAPWRKGIPWGVVLAEGIVLLAVGLFLLFAPKQSGRIVGQILAIVLGVTGAIQLFVAIRRKQAGQLGVLNTVRGALGLGIGVLILVLLLLNALTFQAGQIILGLGSLAYGAIGLYLVYLSRESGLRAWPIVANSLWVLLGALLLIGALGGALYQAVVEVINVLLLLGGAFLIVWAFVIKGRKTPTPVA
jgi:uncharacterized membrane protein HdeD (DUF308 family)